MRASVGRRLAVDALLAVVLVGATTGILEAADADLTAAALVLLLAVVISSLRSVRCGALAAALGYLSCNFFFTPPTGTLEVDRASDLVAGAVFLVTAVIIGAVVARLDTLREQAVRREREAQTRVELTTRLIRGESPNEVASSSAAAMTNLFSLRACRVRFGDAIGFAGDRARLEDTSRTIVRVGDVEVDLVLGALALSGADRAVLDALVAALAAAFDQHRLEIEARDARIRAEVSQSRAGFLSAVSHNLRTPLASIKAAASTLRSLDVGLKPEERRELSDTLVDETERLERLVTNVLGLSRIRAGGLEPRPEAADMSDLAGAAVRRLRPLARAHRIRLAIDEDLPPAGVDVGMMEQIFLNLLENALHYAPPGSEITISARRTGDMIEVRVSDHGPGIPCAERERIFDEFVRVDARADRAGAGLGLAIVRALVTANRGRAWCEETPGGGATLAFSVPAANVAQQPEGVR